MSEFVVRKATEKDIPFIVEAIINAEKSGTSILSYSTIFGLTEEETKARLAEMLEEEVDGCEISISSYLIAEKDNLPAATVGAWIENDEEPSNVLKRNLINYYFPKSSFEKAISVNDIVKDLYIPETENTIQIGIVYVSPDFRGYGLAKTLIQSQISLLSESNAPVDGVEVQVFSNNLSAIQLYSGLGFITYAEKSSDNPNANSIFPSNKKILMKLNIN